MCEAIYFWHVEVASKLYEGILIYVREIVMWMRLD